MESTVINPAMWLTPAFAAGERVVLEGGRLSATQRPTGEELCPQPGRISLSQSTFQLAKGRLVASVDFMAVARTYTYRSGSNALGGTG